MILKYDFFIKFIKLTLGVLYTMVLKFEPDRMVGPK